MEDLKKLAAMTALNNMLQQGHFSICAVDDAAKLLGMRNGRCDAYNTLHALHCIDYAKMPKELRDAIPGLIQQVLGVEPVYQFKTMAKRVLDVNPPADKGSSGGFLKLIGLKP